MEREKCKKLIIGSLITLVILVVAPLVYDYVSSILSKPKLQIIECNIHGENSSCAELDFIIKNLGGKEEAVIYSISVEILDYKLRQPRQRVIEINQSEFKKRKINQSFIKIENNSKQVFESRYIPVSTDVSIQLEPKIPFKEEQFTTIAVKPGESDRFKILLASPTSAEYNIKITLRYNGKTVITEKQLSMIQSFENIQIINNIKSEEKP
jgi:hypothetical protein